MNTKKIIAVSLSAIICSAIITPVASAETEEQIQRHINAAKNHEKNEAKKHKIVKYECTIVTATDEKGNNYIGGLSESANENFRKKTKQKGWKIKEYKGTCVKSVKI
ncbi:TPA: hypothetical protein IGZ65_003053, partial [Escherichia coli]|nr:hypothetical protein [Escherichia coli]